MGHRSCNQKDANSSTRTQGKIKTENAKNRKFVFLQDEEQTEIQNYEFENRKIEKQKNEDKPIMTYLKSFSELRSSFKVFATWRFHVTT